MSRHPLLPTRASCLIGAGVVGAGILAVAFAVAYAQEAPKRLVINSAPATVAFGKTVVIRGHLENGSSGDQVSLQRTTRSGSWTEVRAAPVNHDRSVLFRLKGVRKSARYRLRFAGSGAALAGTSAGSSATSEGVRVRVRPRLTLHVRPGRVMSGRRVRVTGVLRPRAPERRVTIKRRTGAEWRRVARPSVQNGRYSARFSIGTSLRSRVKAVFRGDASSTGAARKRRLVVYERDLASWYGPGLYGNRTACGQTLGYDTVGVAHRTLPCGTKVGILYRGRSIMVPVIDRGPYGSAEWDLTRGAAARLNFSGHGTVGTVH